MAIPAIFDKENTALQTINLLPPAGWFKEDDLRKSEPIAYNRFEQFVASMNYTLPLVTKRVEDLIKALHVELDVIVSTAYLSINSDGGYHTFLLVDEVTYHSPHLVAANLLAEKYTGEDADFSLRATFTIAREHNMSLLTTNQYRLKYVPQPA